MCLKYQFFNSESGHKNHKFEVKLLVESSDVVKNNVFNTIINYQGIHIKVKILCLKQQFANSKSGQKSIRFEIKLHVEFSDVVKANVCIAIMDN